jgi:lipopolysaccharide export LptBFGC system permease protein LptF
MAVQTTEETKPSPAALVGGIVEDAQRLLRQEVQLATQELKQEWQKTKSAAASLAAGLVVLVFAAFILTFMLVYLLDYYTRIPTWGCYGIVGGILALIGICLFFYGKQKASQVQFPPPQTVATLKENAQWIRNQV